MTARRPGVGITEFKRSLPPGTRQRWFASKGITHPTKRHHRDYRGAVAVCAVKLRYTLLGALWDAFRLGNHAYKCVICGHWHTSRQSKAMNRRLHEKTDQMQ